MHRLVDVQVLAGHGIAYIVMQRRKPQLQLPEIVHLLDMFAAVGCKMHT
jgi:hypothetical protein